MKDIHGYSKLSIKEKSDYFRKIFIEIIVVMATVYIIISVITNNMFFIGYVPSASMYPILQQGDRAFVKVFNMDVVKGNIYVFNKENSLMVKRCIATGGDTVNIRNDDVYVNGNLINEAYVEFKNIQSMDMDLIVPEGSYLFLGDNRGNSLDARYWDEPFVNKSDIKGECKFIINPIKRMKKLT